MGTSWTPARRAVAAVRGVPGSSRSGRGRDRGGIEPAGQATYFNFAAVHVPRADRDGDRSRPLCPTGCAGRYCRTARSPAGRRHPRRGTRDRAPRLRTRGRPVPSRPVRPLSRSPGSRPAISAPAFPGRPPPANHRGRQAGCTGMHARLSGSRPAGTRDRRGPSVAVRGKPTVHTDRPSGWTPSAYLHRRGDASGSAVAAFTVSGRTSLCSLALAGP